MICIREYIFASISGDKIPKKTDDKVPKTQKEEPNREKGKNVIVFYQ